MLSLPFPLQAMLKVERPIVQQNLNFITTNIALEGGGETQSLFHMGSLIIFVRDCGYKPTDSVRLAWRRQCYTGRIKKVFDSF